MTVSYDMSCSASHLALLLFLFPPLHGISPRLHLARRFNAAARAYVTVNCIAGKRYG